MIDSEGYRWNVGIVLINSSGQVLIAERFHQRSAWQFPQGGIDHPESGEQALFRELREELGLEPHDVNVLAETQDWLSYEIPQKFRRHSVKPQCIGQKQKWFLLQLVGEDSRIRLDISEHPEFIQWRWVDYWYPIDCIISFKRDVYKKVLEEFFSLVNKNT